MTTRTRTTPPMLTGREPIGPLLDRAPVGIAIGRTDGRIIYVNEMMCRILGRDRDDITVATFVEAAHPDHQLRVRVRLRSIESGRFRTFVRETHFRRPDGSVVNVRFHVSATHNDDGSIAEIIAHAEDITASRQIEAALTASEDRFRAASEASLDALILMQAVRDDEGRVVDFMITDANENAGRLFAHSVIELIGHRVSAHYPSGDEARLHAKYLTVLESGEPMTLETEVVDSRVRARWIREQIVKVDDGVALTLSDISVAKEAEIALRENEERYDALLKHAVDVVCIADAGGFIRYVSPAIERVLGYTLEDFTATHPFDILHPDDVSDWLEQWHDLVGAGDARASIEMRARHADGRYRWMEITIRDLRDEPRIGGFVVHFHDVSDRHEAQQALVHRSMHDGLTGLPNRGLFVDRLGHALDRRLRNDTVVAVLFLDLDHFKTINDSLGHAVGDALLREVGERLRSALRPADTVARFGGDEFVICCEELTDADAAVQTAERIRAVFATPFRAEGQEIATGTSIGIALATDEGSSPEALLRNADAAMYVAKARGRDQVRLYDDALRQRLVEHLDTESGLRAALTAGDIVLHWQPVFRLDGRGPICGVEALVRWNHHERGLLLPADFLGAAALAGLDAPLGAFVLDAACEQLAAWDASGIAPPILWLNLSATQLAWSGTVDRVRETLDRHAIPAARLGFDVAELAIAEIDRARRAGAELAELRDLGCSIALDDFGTGHASPLAVRRYGITHVKLDRSIVQTGASDDPMVPALLSLAAMLGVEVVAEGVETAQQLDRLRRAGCRAAAGNFLAPAMPGADLTELLRTRSR